MPQEDGSFAWLDRENLTDDLSGVVTLKTVYVRRAQNLTDEGGDPTGPLVLRGQALTVTGYRDLAADGSVSYYGSTRTGATAGAAATRRAWTTTPMKSPALAAASCPIP